ncbi:MAG: class I SAM-dependent methyltransferase, partial [Acidimicrobiia bacterium]
LDRPAGRTVVGHTGRVCRIEGWVVARTGRPVTVLARLDGAPVVETAADEPRPDVVVALGRRFPVSPRCGFSFFVDLRGRLGDDGARLTVEFSDGIATTRPVRLRVAPEPALLALETYAGMSPAKLAVAARLLRGRGVELGALHQPLPCDPEECAMQFVDRLSREEALATFPELAEHAEEIVTPDFVVDLDTEDLSVLRPHGFDFFIANDVIEHVANPLRLLRNMHDAMKPGALFFLSAPDCDYTFDAARPLTTRRHLWREYKRGTTTVDRDHVRDFVRGTRPEVLSTSRAEQDAYFDDQLRRSIHVHVWNQASFDEFLDWAIARLGLRLEVIERVPSRDAFGSMTYVLRKTGSD